MSQISQTSFKRRLTLALALPLLLVSVLAASLIGQVIDILTGLKGAVIP